MRLTVLLVALLLCASSFNIAHAGGIRQVAREAVRATTAKIENISNKSISLLVTPLVIITACVNFYACDRVQQVLEPVSSQSDALVQVEDSGHLWVVDQSGVEVPVIGTWELVAQTNPNSPFAIGDSFVLPPETPHKILLSEGTYTDDTGIPWTKANITTADDLHLVFLERVDTSTYPHQLHIVWKITDDHQLLPAYGEYPFEASEHDVQVWEKQ